MSSTKQPSKKVTYERGTKAPSHRHHNSSDSGVGSSSSDRATIRDEKEHVATTHLQQDISDQRYNLRVVQEGLSAAKEHIKHLEAMVKNLNADLGESNKENRVLKKEKSGLLRENEGLVRENQDLVDVIEDLNIKLKIKKKEVLPRAETKTSAAPSERKPERRPSISVRPGPPSPRGLQHPHPEEREREQRPLSTHAVMGEKRPSIRHSQSQSQSQNHPPPPSPRQPVYLDPQQPAERRLPASMYDRTAPLPLVPQPPANHQNPFAPRSVNTVTYAAVPVIANYASSTISYASQQPSYVVSPHGHGSVSGSSSSSVRKERNDRKEREYDDGKYHLKPL